MTFIKPKILSPGQKVALVALSSPVAPRSLDVAADYIRDKGFEPIVPFDPSEFYQLETHGFSSQSVDVRVNALHDCLRDDQIGAILNVRGGYGSMDLLPKIDFELFQKHPKIFVGFSDNTAVLLAAHKLSSMIVLHGPTARSLSDQTLDQDATDSARVLFKLLSGKTKNPFDAIDLKWTSGAAASAIKGRLVGGNLQMLASLSGTKWMPDLAGKILFIEETKEQPYRVDRSLAQLRLAGQLDNLAGVLLGDFRSCKHPYDLGPSVERVLETFFKDAKYPVYSGLPCGHLGLNYPIPLGIEASVSERGEIEFNEEVFA
mgnify:CR=1 FL=1